MNNIYNIVGIDTSDDIKELILKEITTLSFQNRLNGLYKILKSKDSIYNDKFIISMYILTVLYDYIRINQENKELILSIMKEGLYMDNNIIKESIINNIKNIKDFYIKKEICLHIYNSNINIIEYYKINILKFIIFNLNDFKTILVDDIIYKFRNIFDNTTSIYNKMIIADILLNAGFTDIGNDLLDRVRLLQNVNNVNNVNKDKNVYNDSQNVHNSLVNNSVLSACNKIIEDRQMSHFDIHKVYEIIIQTIIENKNDFMSIIIKDFHKIYGKYTIDKSDDDFKKINNDYIYDYVYENIIYIIYKTLLRIKNDITFFTFISNESNNERKKIKKFTLENIFSNVFDFLLNDYNKELILHRLIQELLEMYNYCSTGYMSRLINTLQSFTDKYKINIITDYMRTKTFIYSKIKTYINNNPDILEYFIEMNDNLNKILLEYINNNIKEFINDGHEGDNISKAMCEFINKEIYVYKDDMIDIIN